MTDSQLETDHLRARSTRYRSLAAVFMALFVATVLAAVGYAVLRDRDVRLAQQMERAQGHALIFEDDTTRTLQLVENTLRALPEVVDGPLAAAAPGPLSDMLRRLKQSQPAMRSLSLLDAQGRVRASSNPASIGRVLDLADFSPGDTGRGEASVLRVGPLWEGRDIDQARVTSHQAPGDPRLPAVWPVLMRLGEGTGSVWLLVALNPDYLLGRIERFYRPDSDRVDVVRYDGRGLVSSEDVPQGQDFPYAEVLAGVRANELGTLEGEGLMAYRSSPKYPVFVSVRIDRATVLQEWRRRTLTVLLATLASLAAVGAGYTWLMRRMREGEDAEARQQTTIVRLSQALEQSPSGILIFNTQGRIEYCNPYFCDLTGFGAAQVRGRTPVLFDAEPQREARFAEIMAALREGQIWRGEVLRQRHSGAPLVVQVVAAPLRDVAGRITHCVSIEHDLTEEKRTLVELAQARDRAEAATRAKSAFLANISHEIRTPMNGVIGLASLLLDSPLTAEQREHAQTLRESADSLLHLIDDLLDFSKFEAGKLVLHPVPFGPADMVRRCAQRLQVQARAKGLSLQVEVDDDVPPAVVGDVHRLEQVLINLLGNAIKFTGAGAVRLRLHQGARGLCVEVQDSGIGIDPSQQGRLFQPFTQVDSSTTRAYGGTGLGLSICRQLVEAMGGRIGLRSALGQGSVFWFEVPLPPAPAQALPLHAPSVAEVPTRLSAAGEPGGEEAMALQGRVLLVEDQPINQKLASAVLRRLGLQVLLAQHGQEALECLRTEPVDLVLMDCQMPVMDGLEATARLRAGEAGPEAARLTVLALTANVMPEDVARCHAAGFDGHVAKPFTLDIMRQALWPYLARPQAEAAASAESGSELTAALPQG